MALSWIDRLNGKTEESEESKAQKDLELKPEDISNGFKKVEALETKFNDTNSKLDGILSYIDDQKKTREAAIARENAEKAKTQRAQQESELDPIGDPDGWLKAKNEPLVTNQINMSSLLVRQQVFLEDESNFEYYTGEFKKEVDKYVDQLPLSHRADPASIKNCYYVVLGQKSNEIKENKLKSRFAATSTAASGTGGTSAKQDREINLTADEKKVAKVFGMTEEQYAKNREVSYI